MMEEKRIKKNADLEADTDVDEGFEAYRKTLACQREMCERLGLKVAYYAPPQKIEDND